MRSISASNKCTCANFTSCLFLLYKICVVETIKFLFSLCRGDNLSTIPTLSRSNILTPGWLYSTVTFSLSVNLSFL